MTIMLSRDQLLERHCRPLEGEQGLSPAAVQAQLSVLDGWGFVDGSIVKTYRFADYHETIVSYNRCEVRFHTHSVKGISENDFICAAKADAIYAQRYGGRSA
jgi:4a-hydroxytetrahydrobiopterin dehydratase